LLSAGQTFARYVIEAPIGEGGMGEVYRAFDEKLRRKVALKVLHPDLAMPDAAARLVREARAAAALAHPNTIAIYDLGEIDGTVFLVMELVSGAPLRAYVGDASVPVARKLRWLVDIARGLGAAHGAGLVHRDVKPTNVMISDEGIVKVLDFGLAKAIETSSFHTDAGLVVGTPRYMAAELFTGMAADARSDQYAYGVTAYELLSGAYPGSAMGAVPAALDTIVPEVGPRVARVIARTLSRAPGDRFGTMSEVANALEEIIGGSRVTAIVEAAPPTRREGAAPRANTALALAPTQLQPSGAETRSPSARGGHARKVAAVLGLLAVAGAYGASRFWAAEPAASGPDAAVPLLVPSETNEGGLALVLEAEGGESGGGTTPPAVPAEGADTVDATADADEDAASAALDAAPDSARRGVSLDEFPDPWLKRGPATPPR
jgi:tRNA A-37 threonylcarbamoyl transferase component Bud32